MKEFVRTILDYPVKGIKFRDITSLLQNSDHFKWIQIVNAIPKTWIRLIENEADTWDKKSLVSNILCY